MHIENPTFTVVDSYCVIEVDQIPLKIMEIIP